MTSLLRRTPRRGRRIRATRKSQDNSVAPRFFSIEQPVLAHQRGQATDKLPRLVPVHKRRFSAAVEGGGWPGWARLSRLSSAWSRKNRLTSRGRQSDWPAAAGV